MYDPPPHRPLLLIQLATLGAALSVVGCQATEGPLFTLVEVPDPDAATRPGGATGSGVDAAVPASPAPVGPVRADMRLQYQLTGTIDEAVDADLFVVDLFGASSSVVASLREGGAVVLAYVSAGSHEPWRPDVDQLAETAIGAPLAGYPSERWLDVRDGSVRMVMAERMARAVDKGFDGVVLTSIEAYRADSGFDLTAADQLAYNLWLAEQARARGLAAGVASGWSQAAELAPYVDFAIHVDCIANGRCDELQPFAERGLPVFDLETGGSGAAVCPEAATLGLPVTLKRPNFDAYMERCP